MVLLDELHALQDRLTSLSKYERSILNLAAALAEELYEIETGEPPDRVTTIPFEEYLTLPDRFELWDGRPRPKHWEARVDRNKEN